MPTYSFKCAGGHKFDRYLKLADFDTPQNCECGEIATRQITCAMFQVDFPAYISPTSGKLISSRTQRNEDLKASNCYEYEPSMKQDFERRIAAEDAEMDKKIDEHVEKTIYEMPSAKRERLVCELEAGIDTEIKRI